MPTYLYKARDTTGKPVKGAMEASSRQELIDKLSKMGYMTTQVQAAPAEIKIGPALGGFVRVSTDDLAMFYVQLANMLSAGINILTSLSTLSKRIENRRLREIVSQVSRSVEGGESFSQSLARHPRVFPQVFISMIKAGEASGKLDVILLRYASFAERELTLRQQVKGALLYPSILLGAGIAVTLFIVTFVVPQFVEIFTKAAIDLPLPTVILHAVGMGIKKSWFLFILFFILVWSGLKLLVKTASGRLAFDRLKLKIPVIGELLRKVAISRFTRTLGTLLKSGVPVLEALDITKRVMDNEVLSLVMEGVRRCVEKGQGISEPLRVSGEFPPDTVQMIAVGEETGNLDVMLDKISDFYEQSLSYTLKKITTVIEPALLLVMGAMVGFIMASLLLPIFDMVKMLRH